MHTILARSLLPLRSANVMPRLVHRDYEDRTQELNDTITIGLPSVLGVEDVVPSNVSPDATAQTPQSTTLVLDSWKKCEPFKLSNKDMLEIAKDENFIPGNLAAGIKALADYINADIFSTYPDVYGYHGTAGTTPFGNEKTTDVSQTRKVLNTQLCPQGDRRLVLDPEADASADGITNYTFDKSGDRIVVMEGLKGHKGGFDWYMDQQVPYHTAGSKTGTVTVTGVNAVGAVSIGLTTAAASGIAFLKGDIITFAGDLQTYTATAALTVGASATGNLAISPALKVATAGTEVVSVKASHRVNLGFHKNAIAFASRRQEARENTAQMVDPITGLILRIERIDQYKQTMWELDILYGKKLIRPELITRLAG